MVVLGKDATCENCVFWDVTRITQYITATKQKDLTGDFGKCHHSSQNGGFSGSYYCEHWMNQDMWDAQCRAKAWPPDPGGES